MNEFACNQSSDCITLFTTMSTHPGRYRAYRTDSTQTGHAHNIVTRGVRTLCAVPRCMAPPQEAERMLAYWEEQEALAGGCLQRACRASPSAAEAEGARPGRGRRGVDGVYDCATGQELVCSCCLPGEMGWSVTTGHTPHPPCPLCPVSPQHAHNTASPVARSTCTARGHGLLPRHPNTPSRKATSTCPLPTLLPTHTHTRARMVCVPPLSVAPCRSLPGAACGRQARGCRRGGGVHAGLAGG